jgi:hypothetical protein
MGQRSGERKAVSLDAVVGCARFGLLRGRIVDLGLGGLYVEAQTSIVPIGAEVTVTFQAAEGADTRWLSLQGRVSHQSLQGFGIAFEPPGDDCIEILQRLLPAMSPVPLKAAPVLRMI